MIRKSTVPHDGDDPRKFLWQEQFNIQEGKITPEYLRYYISNWIELKLQKVLLNCWSNLKGRAPGIAGWAKQKASEACRERSWQNKLKVILDSRITQEISETSIMRPVCWRARLRRVNFLPASLLKSRKIKLRLQLASNWKREPIKKTDKKRDIAASFEWWFLTFYFRENVIFIILKTCYFEYCK